MSVGKLILLPNLLEESLSHELFLPANIGASIAQLNGLIAESEKSARRYLRRFLSHEQMSAISLKLLNEHTLAQAVGSLLAPIVKGETWGLVSDAGLPCIADPGANLVAAARRSGVQIEAISGPCAVILALQLSGFSGQRFCFHGYLPREESFLEKTVKELEKQSVGMTQIWIEAPYRSMKMLHSLIKMLQPSTQLCVAASLTAPSQKVASYLVREWQSVSFELGKEPAVFLIFRSYV